jgi:hypothetical protein
MRSPAVLSAPVHRDAIRIVAILLLCLPLESASGQYAMPAGVRNISFSQDSLSSESQLHGPAPRGTQQRVLKGVVMGATAGVAAGIVLWAMRTFPAAAACDVDGALNSSDDSEPQRCNWRAYKRRAQYTWTGLVAGSVLCGIIGRIAPD